jgi:RNA polymerase sigma-70 factor (ECF subfamily)
VVDEHGPFVCRSLRYLGVLEADLDDLLQEVFLVVNQRLNEYVERGRLRSWLYSICVRVSRAQRRKLGRRRESPIGVIEQTAVDNPLNQLEERQSLALGEQLLEALPPQQREVFMLYEVEDMSMPEIAQALGCPLQTAYSRLYMARARILAAVQSLAVESDP